jgi:hypothetical protein
VINDELYDFKSFIMKSSSEPSLLAQILKHKRNRVTEEACCFGLKTLVEMCIADSDIMEYVFKCPSPTGQFARYSDWIYPYILDVKEGIENARTTYMSNKTKKELVEALMEMQEKFEEATKKFKDEEDKARAAAKPTDF